MRTKSHRQSPVPADRAQPGRGETPCGTDSSLRMTRGEWSHLDSNLDLILIRDDQRLATFAAGGPKALRYHRETEPCISASLTVKNSIGIARLGVPHRPGRVLAFRWRRSTLVCSSTCDQCWSPCQPLLRIDPTSGRAVGTGFMVWARIWSVVLAVMFIGVTALTISLWLTNPAIVASQPA